MPSPNQPFYRDKHLFVDLRNEVVMLDLKILTLTHMEYRLLALLVEHAGLGNHPKPAIHNHLKTGQR
jgi:DNA-binding response OmpR family regulator